MPLPWAAEFCPYGKPGTKLWVRETHWQYLNRFEVAWYCADGPEPVFEHEAKKVQAMPRWASRITLEITAVRVERLQEISVEDAFAEGIAAVTRRWRTPLGAVGNFRILWDSTKSEFKWAANPWVWVISFKRVK
jgi:hypothetical protein